MLRTHAQDRKIIIKDWSMDNVFDTNIMTNWGEPERAPHKREVRAACLSVCLSVCPYIHDTKIYKNSSNLRDTFSC